MHHIRTVASVLSIVCLSAATLSAAEIKISSLPELQAAVSAAKPGTRIVVANGVYAATNAITIARQGTARRPIVIAAETVGGVEIAGTNGFTLAKPAAYVIIEGFKFTHATGGERVMAGANHCRYTRNIFQLAGFGHYLLVEGDDTEIDHNSFQNKFTGGQMVYVQGPGATNMAQRTWIHHNCFTNFPDMHQNNCSAIQIGLSGRSLSPAHSLVEHNLFIACRGENENICNKSCDNTYRFNTFENHCSELSLRHGNRNIVYANFFIGTDGLRVFGKDDRIYCNYFQDCTRGIHLGNGDGVVPQSRLTAHDRPDGIQIVFNTLVNNRDGLFMAQRRNGLGATNITIADNLIAGTGRLVTVDGPVAHSVWQGNLVWGDTAGITNPATGFVVTDPQLKPDAVGIYRLQPGSPAIGKAVGSYRYVTLDMDGQRRFWRRDIGADQFSSAPVVNRILASADVGPFAPEAPKPAPLKSPRNASGS